MNENAEPAEGDRISTDIPKALHDRVEEYCRANGMTPSEFIFDAISEKLSSVHRERRRKPRL